MNFTLGGVMLAGTVHRHLSLSLGCPLEPVEATTCLPVALLQVVQALWVALLANVGLVDHKVLASSLLR